MKIKLPFVKKPKDNYLVLIGFVVACQAVGGVGTIFTIPSIPTWYASLNKPIFSPPNWIFGPVWTLLYLLMGISAYLVWRKFQFGSKSRAYWQAFAIQLTLNGIWSPIFFGLRWTGEALLVILLMWYAIYRTIKEAGKLSPWSAKLLYPYLAWVSFASLLNLAIFALN